MQTSSCPFGSVRRPRPLATMRTTTSSRGWNRRHIRGRATGNGSAHRESSRRTSAPVSANRRPHVQPRSDSGPGGRRPAAAAVDSVGRGGGRAADRVHERRQPTVVALGGPCSVNWLGTSGIGCRAWTADSATPDGERVARRRRWRGWESCCAWAGVAWLRALRPTDVPMAATIAGRSPRVDVHPRADAGRRRAVRPSACAELVAGRSGARARGCRLAAHRDATLSGVVDSVCASRLVGCRSGAGSRAAHRRRLVRSSFALVRQVPAGFKPDAVLTFEVSLTVASTRQRIRSKRMACAVGAARSGGRRALGRGGDAVAAESVLRMGTDPG